jgi:hypothetical protein
MNSELCFEYIEKVVVDIRQEMVHQLGGWACG